MKNNNRNNNRSNQGIKKNNKAAVGRIFEKLERGARAGKAKPRAKGETVDQILEGKVQGSGRGFAFLIPEDKSRDCFIPARNLNGAMHGDFVRARLIEEGTATRGGVVTVEEVLRRGTESFVGLVEKVGAFYTIKPDDRRLPDRVDVLAGELKGAKAGDKVVARFTDYGSADISAEAAVTEILGDAETVGVDVLSVIRSYGLYEEFDAAVLDEAHAAPSSVDQESLKGREDFRDHLIITVDGEDAKDLDDAIAVKRTGGGWELAVHIADVSHYVRENTAIDKEAFHRGTSVYFPDRVLPMLPRELSNGICSLSEGVDRLTLSCIMTFDADGERTGSHIAKSVIRTRHRMTYTAVQAIFDGDKETRERYDDVIVMLEEMRELASVLRNKRFRRGAVDFAVSEARILLDQHTGKIAEIAAMPRDASHRLIEEFMLAANEAVAYKFDRMDAPFVYRVHETPDPEKIAALQAYVAGFGLSVNAPDGKVTPQDIQTFLKSAEGQPFESVVNKVSLRAMQKAKYSEVCDGHFGLAAQYYCHFTSPIRRYPDLSIHRIISAFLVGGKAATERFASFVAESSIQSSEREVLAQEAEREVDDLKKAEYMRDRLGEEFDGVVNGVTSFGLFVELPNTIEGLVRLETLPDTNTRLDEEKYVLYGNAHTYRLGDPIRVRCVGASVEARRVEFVLAEVDASAVQAEIHKMSMPGGEKYDRFSLKKQGGGRKSGDRSRGGRGKGGRHGRR